MIMRVPSQSLVGTLISRSLYMHDPYSNFSRKAPISEHAKGS